MQITRFLIPLLLIGFTSTQVLRADELAEPPFQPVWDLLNRQEKQQFISGYLFGMRDAATMTGILDDFVKENPNSARESVQRIRGIYEDMASGKPDALAREIDAFYKNPRNREAPLSRAITSARNKL